MIKLAADEDFNNRILRGLLRRRPGLDVVRVQDVLSREERDDDRKILEWAAAERRVLLTHDITTMQPFAEARVAEGKPMPGVFEVSQYLPIGQAIEEILLLAECSLEGEWEGQIRFLPLR
jgi:predicted nuclease of predicted toxin-antitoxin system